LRAVSPSTPVASQKIMPDNNIVEQDHRRIKRLVRPGLGFGSLPTARPTLAGYEAMAMIRKGQVHNIGGRDMQAQTIFVTSLSQMAA
jgi:transposase, IS6 family